MIYVLWKKLIHLLQGYIKLIKSDSKDFYNVTKKHFCQINVLLKFSSNNPWKLKIQKRKVVLTSACCGGWDLSAPPACLWISATLAAVRLASCLKSTEKKKNQAYFYTLIGLKMIKQVNSTKFKRRMVSWMVKTLACVSKLSTWKQWCTWKCTYNNHIYIQVQGQYNWAFKRKWEIVVWGIGV